MVDEEINISHRELLNHGLANKNKMVVDAEYGHACLCIGDQ